jgi:general L-amino acid transport system permease protein
MENEPTMEVDEQHEIAPEGPTLSPRLWMRENLFSSGVNGTLTVLSVILIAFLVRNLIAWIWAPNRGWNAVATNMRFLMVHAYPAGQDANTPNQFARVWVAVGIVLVLAAFTLAAWKVGSRIAATDVLKRVRAVGLVVALAALLGPPSVDLDLLKWDIPIVGWLIGIIGALLTFVVEAVLMTGGRLLGFLIGAAIALAGHLASRATKHRGDEVTIHSLWIPATVAALAVVALWVVPIGHYYFVEGQPGYEPGTVAMSTKAPWTILLLVAVGAYFVGRALSRFGGERRLRAVAIVGWALSLPVIVLFVLRDPDFNPNHEGPGLEFLSATDIRIWMVFAVLGSALIFLLSLNAGDGHDSRGLEMDIQGRRIRPLPLAGGVFLILAPFLTWRGTGTSAFDTGISSLWGSDAVGGLSVGLLVSVVGVAVVVTALLGVRLKATTGALGGFGLTIVFLFVVQIFRAFPAGSVVGEAGIGLFLALVGGVLVVSGRGVLTNEGMRVLAAALLILAFALWAFPVLMRIRILAALFAVFAIGSKTFAGDRQARLRYLGLWIGLTSVMVALFAAINTQSTLTVPGKTFLGGLALTFVLALTSITLSFPIGLLMALGRTSSMPLFRLVSTVYIELVRGIPFITVLIFFNLILVLFLPGDVHFDSVTLAIIAGTLFSAAYLAENVRGGLQSIPKGQYEAARAMGLSTLQLTVFIVLPQALRAVIPALVGQTIAIFKDTSLVAIIGLFDFLYIANRVINAQTAFLGIKLEAILFISVVYWMFTFSFSRASLRIEKKLGLGER